MFYFEHAKKKPVFQIPLFEVTIRGIWKRSVSSITVSPLARGTDFRTYLTINTSQFTANSYQLSVNHYGASVFNVSVFGPQGLRFNPGRLCLTLKSTTSPPSPNVCAERAPPCKI